MNQTVSSARVTLLPERQFGSLPGVQ